MTASSARFYESLASFSDFAAVTDEARFAPVPSDWSVLITDVVDSTRAIEQGRYKDVNTLGAATIACARNATGGLPFPFVFGGDGATLAVPPSHRPAVARSLGGLRQLARRQFDLELRVGCVPVAALRERGASVDVGRLQLAGGASVAVFRGGGLALADELVKREPDAWAVPDAGEVDLKGLSCRWQPIPPRHGRSLSLLVAACAPDAAAVYREVIARLEDILPGGIEAANPVDSAHMAYRSVAECLRDERRYHASALSRAFLARAAEIALAVLVFRHGLRPLFFDARRYAAAMRTHTDYRKFDDILRLTLDCAPEHVTAIRACLTELQRAGRLRFGLHEADASLMTCLVGGLDDGAHLHFVDGGEGGYTMAARALRSGGDDAGG